MQHTRSENHDQAESRDETLERVRTAGTVSMSPELFEKLYLSPQNNVQGELRKTIGNPTPMSVLIPPPLHDLKPTKV